MGEQETSTREEFSLGDVCRLLLRKLKLLIVVLLVGVVCGAAFGYARSYNVHYYGTRLEYFINPTRETEGTNDSDSQYAVYGAYGVQVMETIVTLLNSEQFAERLELDADGLPRDKDGNALIDDATLKAAIAEAENAQTALTAARAELEAAENACLTATEETKAQLEAAKNTAAKAVSAAAEDVTKKTDAAVAVWGNFPSSKKLIARNNACVSYSYSKSSSSVTGSESFARSFIYVEISVLNDKAAAEDLYKKVNEVLPVFVAEVTTVPTGYSGTRCNKTTRNDQVTETNEGYTLSTVVKYGVVVGFVALLAACIVVIAIDRSDKRLRSIEQIAGGLNVPVLGVIPTMEDEEQSTGVER